MKWMDNNNMKGAIDLENWSMWELQVTLLLEGVANETLEMNLQDLFKQHAYNRQYVDVLKLNVTSI